jgi:mono/diheme cytochrome c family protein
MSRVQLEITLGILFVLISGTVFIAYGFNENNRMAQYAVEQHAQAIEVGASLFDTYCSPCHGKQGLGTPGLCPPLNDRYFFDQRLKDVGWSGSQEDYIIATASGGRLTSTRPDQFPGQGKPAMPSFSDRFGGPLRDDQIRYIADFIMNWESTAQLVQAAPTPAGPAVGTDITQSLPQGDPAAGQKLAETAGCVACHVTTTTGPAWNPSGDQPGIGTRATTRYTQSDYTGKATSPEQYLFESIVNPSVYLVPSYNNLMPPTFGTSLTLQDVADLIAYLETIK